MKKTVIESTLESLFTSSEVLKAVNITYRQLSYWELKGIIKPTYQKLGTRDFKRYTQQDIDTLKTVKSLLDEGYTLPATDTIKEIAKRKELEEALRESEERYRTLVENINLGITLIDTSYRVIMANAMIGKLFNKSVKEIIGKNCFREFEKREAICSHCPGTSAMATGKPLEAKTEGVRDNGSRFSVRIQAFPRFGSDGAVEGFIEVIEDITELKEMEKEQVLRLEILKVFHQNGLFKNICGKVISLIKEYLGCEVVALRIKEGDDYPYFINDGFSEEFIKSENYLCVHDEKGNCLRDSKGQLIIACMCGIIINAKFNKDKPFFTKEGSFWTNSTSDLLASTTSEDRGVTTRNVCNDYGYESVALVSIKSTSNNLGLLQINSKRRNLFSSENVRFLEEVGYLIGIAVERTKVEEKNKQYIDSQASNMC